MKKLIFTVLVLGIAMLFVVSIWLFRHNQELKTDLEKITKEQEERINNGVILESEKARKKVERDLEEKYRADIVSYNAMKKRIELEEEMRKMLEQKLEERENRRGLNEE